MKILFISLGCDKNLVDSEHMLGLLVKHGYEITDDETQADIIVINTCCFIHDAKEESIENILQMAEYKKQGSCKVLLVTGCMAERYREEIHQEIPEVDAVLGTNSYDRIVLAIEDVLRGSHYEDYAELTGIPKTDGGRIVTTGGYYEYLKIAEGCDKHCTYCIIPKLRGSYRSVPMEDLLEEARTMAAGGVRELVLVAQETTLYGTDLYGKPSLHLLLKELCKIPELYWIRILYCYPEDIYPELIQTMKEEKKICHYLDLPIQHANDEILRRMGRRTSKEELVQIITTLREEIPDITLRTTLITGFPGETKEQHEELLEFVNDMEFDRLGVFTYSPEEGTPAANMDHQIDEETKLDRQAELMELQQDISMELGERKIGQVLTVMIEGKEYTERQLTGSGLIYYVRKELPDSLSIAVEESESGAVIRVVKEEQTVLAEFQVTADPSSSQMEVICVQNGYTVLRRPVSVDGENAELARQVADLVIFPEGGK